MGKGGHNSWDVFQLICCSRIALIVFLTSGPGPEKEQMMHISALIVSFQELKEELKGECRDFQAVPGHGLKCAVSGLQEYTRETEWTYSKVLSREVCVQTDVNLMIRDIELGPSERVYQVRIAE